MQKIIFGITSLTFGGAERVLIDIVNELAEKYEVTVFTLYGNGELEKELSSKVKHVKMIDKSFIQISKKEKILISLKLLFNKKSIYKKYIGNGYSTEIAFLEGPITRLFSVKNKKVKKIAWIHNDISKVFGRGIKSYIKRIIDKFSYSKFDDIVFVSKDNLDVFEKVYNTKNNKIVIPNYISTKRVLRNSELEINNVFEANEVNFLTVARLTEQKAIDRLVKVHSQLVSDGIKHNFYVIGDGQERENIENLIKKYNVEKSFKLLGKKDNPYPYIKNCDVFALLSNYEGLPITVLEARILNKPIIITNTAAREAVIGYNKCYIADNSDEGVYNAIKTAINSLSEWNEIKDVAFEENEEIINQIEKLVR